MSDFVYHVPADNIAAMVVTFVLCFALPLALCVIWKKRTKAGLTALFAGAATFFVAALVLEQIARGVLFLLFGERLTSDLLMAAVFGGLMAGLFEETGRYVTMRFFLKKKLSRENAIMYGIGHGGIEAMLITGMAYFSNLILTFLINTGSMEVLFVGQDEQTQNLLLQQLAALWELQPSAFLMAGVERISAILLHIGLSYFVYLAVKKGKLVFYGMAVLLHFGVDAGVVLLNRVVPVMVLEAILLAVVIILTIAVAGVYRRESEEVTENAV